MDYTSHDLDAVERFYATLLGSRRSTEWTAT
jgi:hypothetical protein